MGWPDDRLTTDQKHLDAEMRKAAKHLRRSDAVMAELVERFGVHRLEASRSYFQLMVATVISQQLSTKAANSIYKRLVDSLGGHPLRPRLVLEASHEQLRSAGLSNSKATYLHNLAEAFTARRMGPKTFARMRDEEVIAALTSIKGIGEWSAHMFLMFGLCRMDIFPIGDLGLRNAMVKAYGLRKSTALKRYHRIAEAWSPYRTVGSLYLWRTYDE